MTSLPARARLARWATRSVNRASRALGRGAGTVAGGHVGLRICPDLLERLSAGRTCILVSATNGKTTTTALVAAGWGGEVVSNTTGANMPEGHVAALVENGARRCALEVDEAWLARVLLATAPAVVVLGNLSRDQLDRATEVRALAERWRAALGAYDGVVVANANDPLVVHAASSAPRVRWVAVPTPWSEDARSCPRCTGPLASEGESWSCATCGLARPSLDGLLDGESLHLGGRHYTVRLGLPGEFNRANAALAAAALAEVGVGPEESLVRMGGLGEVAGRYGVRTWRGRRLRLLLAKNPAGVAALVPTMADAEEVWVDINARVADGHDPSWLYDAPFEGLAGQRVRCLGERRLDLATRLFYGGVEAEVVEDLDSLAGEGEVLVVANYTAFAAWLERSEAL